MANFGQRDDHGREAEQVREQQRGGRGAAGTPGRRTLTEGLSRPSHVSPNPAGRGGIELPEGLRGSAPQERGEQVGDGSFGAEPPSAPAAGLAGRQAGGLRVSPVRFTDIAVGDTGEQRLELENAAPRQVRIVNWTMEGEAAGDFEVQLPRLFDLGQGGRYWGEVRFRPAQQGPRLARLAIQSDLPGTTTTVELIGGVDQVPAGATTEPSVAVRNPSQVVSAERPGSGPLPPKVVPGSHVASVRQPRVQEVRGLPPRGRAEQTPFPDAIALSDRNELIRETGNQLIYAAIAFKAACDHVMASEAAKAKASSDVMATLTEVAFGLLVPGLGRIAEGYSKRLVTSYLDAAIKGFLADRDLVKATFTGVTKVGAQVIVKQQSKALFGDTELSHLLDLMAQNAMVAFASVTRDLDHLEVPEMIALWTAYHESVTNKATFEAVLVPFVEGYKRFVSPIGKPRPGENYPYEMQIRAMWLTKAGGRRLAFVMRDAGGYSFGGWIPDTVAPHAIEKTTRMFGSVSFLRQDAVREVP